MFQLGSLVVLCGLLIGTSDSRLDLDVGNLVKNLDIASSVGDVLQNVNLDLGSLQEITDLSTVKSTILEALNSLDLSKLNPVSSKDGYGLQINKLNFLNLQAEPSSNDEGIDLKLPLVLDASLSLPVIGSTVDVSISLELATSLGVQRDTNTLSIGECSSDADNISISLLGRQSTYVNKIFDSVSAFLTKTVTSLLQNQICPVVQFILKHVDVNLAQKLISGQLLA